MERGGTTRVKICGLTNERDLEVAVDAGADAVGVVSAVPVDSPREVAPSTAAELIAAVPPFVTSVLVTMPETLERALELATSIAPDAIQIHGGMTPEELSTLGDSIDGHLLYAIDADAVATEETRSFDAVADGLVVDTTDADGGGGTGEIHDWEQTRAATTPLTSPVILAGGLTPSNVAEAIDVVAPFAVDVSSGVESSAGTKDEQAIHSFVQRARDSDRGQPS